MTTDYEPFGVLLANGSIIYENNHFFQYDVTLRNVSQLMASSFRWISNPDGTNPSSRLVCRSCEGLSYYVMVLKSDPKTVVFQPFKPSTSFIANDSLGAVNDSSINSTSLVNQTDNSTFKNESTSDINPLSNATNSIFGGSDPLKYEDIDQEWDSVDEYYYSQSQNEENLNPQEGSKPLTLSNNETNPSPISTNSNLSHQASEQISTNTANNPQSMKRDEPNQTTGDSDTKLLRKRKKRKSAHQSNRFEVIISEIQLRYFLACYLFMNLVFV